MNLNFVSLKEVQNHTHGLAAALRSSGGFFAQRFSKITGLRSVFVEMSASDQRKGRIGTRVWRWAKDLQTLPKYHNKCKDDIRVMIDLDYYVDMPRKLSKFQPHLLHTFCPRTAGKGTGAGEYAYWWNPDNTVRYLVPGGGNYIGPLWDYSPDCIAAIRTRLGITTHYTVYNIDRKYVDDDHQMILLTPVRQFTGLGAMIAARILEHTELKRMTPVRNGYVRMSLVTKGPGGQAIVNVSTARVGSMSSATVPIAVDDAIALRAANAKNALTCAAVQAQIPKEIMAEQPTAHIILHDFYQNTLPWKQPTYFPVEHSVFSYQFKPEKYDPDAKNGLHPFMRPIMNGCYSPDRCVNNEQVCVNERITKVASSVQMSPLILQYALEFIPKLGPLQELVPTDVEEVYARQHRPSQQRILHQADGAVYHPDVLRTFQKSEAYGKPGDPRMISTIDGSTKRDWSRFMYALSEAIKAFDWYAFGKTPRQICTRVATVCYNAQFVVNSDLSRMDGRISPALREFEAMVMMHMFRPQFHVEIADLLKSQQNLKAYCTFDTTYDQGTARASGSPETSIFNTIDNAFMMYVAGRLSGLDPTAAFHALGIYGGDDGITANIPLSCMQKAASMVGQVLTSEEIPQGSNGVKFLARLYGPNVFYGDANSMCDVFRTLSKFHTTAACPTHVTPAEKLLEKARALSTSDANTPVIGWFIDACQTAFGVEWTASQLDNLHLWGVHYNQPDQYVNCDDEWMRDHVETLIDCQTLVNFAEWTGRPDLTINDVLNPPCLVWLEPSKSDKPVVINGDVVMPDIVAQEPSEVKKEDTYPGGFKPQQKKRQEKKGKGKPTERSGKYAGKVTKGKGEKAKGAGGTKSKPPAAAAHV